MKKWVILFSIGIFILLANLDMTIVNLALAVLAKDYFASMQQVQLVIISYLAAAALFFCFAGKLADFFGKKNIFLLGSLLFVISSLYLGVMAQSINAIIIGRFFQGLGFAATLGLAVVLIMQEFPPEKKGFATGAAVTLTGLGLAVGPPLGGFILQYFGWRWIFLLNVPLGVLSIVLTYFFVSRDPKVAGKVFKLDIISTPFFFIGILILIYALYSINEVSINELLLLIFIGLTSLSFFFWKSLHATHPLINVALLKNNGYLFVLMIRMIFMFIMANFLFLLPLYLQNILFFSAVDTGLWLLCMTASIIVLAPITGRLIDVYGYRIPLMGSICFLLLSCVAFLNLQNYLSFTFFLMGLVSFGLSNGMHTTSSVNGAISQVAPQYSGTAIGLFFTIAMIGAMSGVAFSGLIIDKISHYKLIKELSLKGLSFSTRQNEILFSVANGSQKLHDWNVSFLNESLATIQHATSASFILAFHIMMAINLVLATIGIILCLALFKLKKPP